MDIEEFKKEWYNGDNWVSAHTSGSTGAPKNLRLLKSDMKASARLTNEFFDIGSHSILAIPLSMDYIAGKMMAVRSFEANCRLEVIEPSNHFSIPKKADLLSIVPSQLPHFLEKRPNPDSVRAVLIGGASISVKECSAIAEAGYRAYATFGMTETCSHIALSPISINLRPYEGMPGVTFERDPRGCLVINAPMLSCGRIVTNDLVDLLDSRHFYWKGRIDNAINSGGIKILPESLENEIAIFFGDDFYIIGYDDAKWGQRVGMVVKQGATPIDELEKKLLHRLKRVMRPSKIWVMSQLPSTSTGKLLRIIPEEGNIYLREIRLL